MTKVGNVKVYHGPMEKAVYVGRPSIWGNPFAMHGEGDRVVVIDKYKVFINNPDKKNLRNLARKVLKDKILLCWCHPKPCHADVLAQIADSQIEE